MELREKKLNSDFEGWVMADEVYIPPIESDGFAENILIRKEVTPVRLKKEVIREYDNNEYSEEKTYVFDKKPSKQDQTMTMQLQPMVAKVYIRRVRTGEVVELTKNEFVIGKSIKSDYIVRDNSTVSRRHAQITKRADGYWLEDLNSSNYTYVKGERIFCETKLENNMRFCLSDDEEFVFEVKLAR